MYPEAELTTLAATKARLRRRITRQRTTGVTAATDLLRPVEWLDRTWTRWRQIAPLLTIATVFLGWRAKRAFRPRTRLLRACLHGVPLVMRIVRSFRTGRRKAGSTPTA